MSQRERVSAVRAWGPGRLALAGAAYAALSVAAFPPLGAWPCAFVMLAPLAAGLEGLSPRRAFGFAFWASAAMGLAIVHWLVYALADEYGVNRAAAWLFTVGLVGLYALVPASALALYARLRPRATAAAAPLLLAACFVASEWLRAVPLGLPWLLGGQALAPAPLWLQSAEAFGWLGPSALVATTGGALAIAWRRRSALPLATGGALLALAAAFGALRLADPYTAAAPLRVGIVQASIPQHERFQSDSAPRNLARLAALTRDLRAGGPLDLVVWSETAIDADLDRSPALLAAVSRLSEEVGAPILTGTLRTGNGHLSNAVVLVDGARGVVGSYEKQRLVPFAESDPAWGGWLAPLLGPVTEGIPYRPGDASTLLPAASPFGAPVCFEITYPDLVRSWWREGAGWLANLSNDAWFGRTGYADLHFAHVRLRAVEGRSWIVRGANTGISAIVDPAGRVQASLGVFAVGTLRGVIHPERVETLYARFGDAPALALLGAVAVAAVARDPRRRRRGAAADASFSP